MTRANPTRMFATSRALNTRPSSPARRTCAAMSSNISCPAATLIRRRERTRFETSCSQKSRGASSSGAATTLTLRSAAWILHRSWSARSATHATARAWSASSTVRCSRAWNSAASRPRISGRPAGEMCGARTSVLRETLAIRLWYTPLGSAAGPPAMRASARQVRTRCASSISVRGLIHTAASCSTSVHSSIQTRGSAPPLPPAASRRFVASRSEALGDLSGVIIPCRRDADAGLSAAARIPASTDPVHLLVARSDGAHQTGAP